MDANCKPVVEDLISICRDRSVFFFNCKKFTIYRRWCVVIDVIREKTSVTTLFVPLTCLTSELNWPVNYYCRVCLGENVWTFWENSFVIGRWSVKIMKFEPSSINRKCLIAAKIARNSRSYYFFLCQLASERKIQVAAKLCWFTQAAHKRDTTKLLSRENDVFI